MDTERASPRYEELDLWEGPDILDAIIEGQLAAVAAVHSARRTIQAAADAVKTRLREGGRLIYAGAGTSGRLALQDAVELVPTFNWPADRLLLLMAGGPEAVLRSVEGAEDQTEQAIQLIAENAVKREDTLIAVAASGTTPFTVSCLRAAKAQSALTIGIANNSATTILEESDFPIFLDTGPEVIAGSTRLGAGTAQKIALNALSTLVMILLGKTYKGRMVDVRISNKKLERRAIDMLTHLSGCSVTDAESALSRACGNVKLALLLLRGCEPTRAVELLNAAEGHLRRALQRLPE